MQTHQQAWKHYGEPLTKWIARYFQRYTRVKVMRHCCIFVMIALLVLEMNAGDNGNVAYASTTCAQNAVTYTMVRGDTLSGIASRYRVNWRVLASDNHLANPNLIYSGQVICIGGMSSQSHQAYTRYGPAKSRNVFPYGACTWWADQRYYQLHGIYVPWKTQANAWQWVARAYQFGWRVSTRPSLGAIVVLQPWVEGAYGSGHVAVVERILRNGHVIASNMSWGRAPWSVAYVQFAPGPGVRFISR